ncbi:hypothetical protein [Streptomyces sp. NPDC048473]|uniref:hypothetical protein n=1 Tax=unclassified Streptomyces TaxID=2593676 RepID=UPI00371A568A
MSCCIADQADSRLVERVIAAQVISSRRAGRADAHNVAPAVGANNPTQAQALDRLALLAGRPTSVIRRRLVALTSVLSTVIPRAAG